MSGGSFDYMYSRVEQTYVGEMRDPEMDALMKDLVEVLHDLEWYVSADYSRKDYQETLDKFKAKWFKQSREERLRAIVKEECSKLERKLMCCIGKEVKDNED